MLNGFRSRLTYANLMATVAVFLALGGGAYALTGVPDRSGVFHGCVSNKAGVLRVVKSARSCQKPSGRGKRRNPGEFAVSWNQQGPPGLQGNQGNQGDPGTPGAPGANATKLFAWIRDAGSSATPVVQYGSGITSVADTSTAGFYIVTFNRSLDNCVVTAQSGIGAPITGSASSDSTEFASTTMSAGSSLVGVGFVKPGGTAADTSFFITALC